MKRILLIFVAMYFLFTTPVMAQDQTGVVITSPLNGQVVQGLQVVTGSTNTQGFSSYELAFAYEDDPTDTWFVIVNRSILVVEGNLGTWDTTSLTDGDYTLRLRVFNLDGTNEETVVTGLRVRNYTPVPTNTATATATSFAQIMIPTAQLVTLVPATVMPVHPSPTPLPVNPVSLSVPGIYGAIGRGALLSLLLFVVGGFFLRLRRN